MASAATSRRPPSPLAPARTPAAIESVERAPGCSRRGAPCLSSARSCAGARARPSWSAVTLHLQLLLLNGLARGRSTHHPSYVSHPRACARAQRSGLRAGHPLISVGYGGAALEPRCARDPGGHRRAQLGHNARWIWRCTPTSAVPRALIERREESEPHGRGARRVELARKANCAQR
jgi:hypothetical protein